jgi:hypothetical protein
MRTSVVCLSLGVLLGCGNGLSPAGGVTGKWTASRVELSSTLELLQFGGSVSGTGSTTSFIFPPTTTFSIAGTYSRPHLELTFSNNGTVISHFTGTVQDATHMTGVETSGGGTDTLIYVRQ